MEIRFDSPKRRKTPFCCCRTYANGQGYLVASNNSGKASRYLREMVVNFMKGIVVVLVKTLLLEEIITCCCRLRYEACFIMKKKWLEDGSIKKFCGCWYECFSEHRTERLNSLNLSLRSASTTSIVAKYTPVWYSSHDKSVAVFVVTTKLSSCLGGCIVCLALGGVTDMPHFSANETAISHTVFHSLSVLKLFKVVLVALIHVAAAA